MKATKIIWFLMVSLLVISCSKTKKTTNKLEGEWQVYEYKVSNSQGLTYFYTAEGTITFKNFSENICDYFIDITYDNQGTIYSKNESGTLILHEDGEYYDMNRLNADETTTVLEDGRIILLTSDDLKTYFGDEFGLHQFILEK